MSDSWETTDFRVHRSYADSTVWVPVVPDDDMTCFLHAGSLRAAKRYVEGELERDWSDDVKFRWTKQDERVWVIEVQPA